MTPTRRLLAPLDRRIARRRAARRRAALTLERAWRPVAERASLPTPRQPKRPIRRGRAARSPGGIRHGTNAGYAAHRARGEDACQACRHAHAAYNRRH
jgi:hypothetical protein